MPRGVRYIKVAKIDGNGINRGATLSTLTKLTIPYTSGNVTYDILSRIDYGKYFLYYVENENIDFNDRATINYALSCSVQPNFNRNVGTESEEFDGYKPTAAGSEQVMKIPLTSSTLDNLGFLTDGVVGINRSTQNTALSQQGLLDDSYTYKLQTYPQETITANFSGRCQLKPESHTYSAVKIKLAIRRGNDYIGNNPNENLELLDIFQPSATSQEISASSDAVTASFDISASITASTLNPGDSILPVLFPIASQSSIGITASFDNTIFTIFSPLADGTIFSGSKTSIPEPLFTHNYSNALDCQPFLNNVINNRSSVIYQDLDYTTGLLSPTNFDLIIKQAAIKAKVQDSNYTLVRHINPRYDGSKSTSQLLNKWSPTDIGTFGKLPTVENLKTKVIYAEATNAISGFTPERMNCSAVDITYLIDENGGAESPDVGQNSLQNVQGTFITNENVVINSKKPGGGEATTIRKIIRGGSRIENILYTQKGAQPNASFTSSIKLVDTVDGPGAITDNYGNTGQILQINNYERENRLRLQSSGINAGLIVDETFSLTGDAYRAYQVPAGVLTDNVTLKFHLHQLNFNYLMGQYSPSIAGGYYSFRLGIILKKNDETIGLYQKDYMMLNWPDDYLSNLSISHTLYDSPTFEVNPSTLAVGDKISFQYRTDILHQNSLPSGLSPLEIRVTSGYYSVTQTPLPNLPIDVDENKIWGYYDTVNHPNVITSSTHVSASLDAFYGDSRVKQKDLSDSGFNPISLPWSINTGDEFRFEGDENFVYMVSKAFGPNEVSDSRLTPTGSIEVQFNKGLPVSASIDNFNLDHFNIRRYIDDSSVILIEGFKPVGSEGPYIISPEYRSSKLNGSIDEYITDLTEKGLIS